MCYTVYLGTNVPMKTSRWNESAPGFYLSSEEDEIEIAQSHFSTSHVYYAGSYQGCGCGFFCDNEDAAEDVELSRESVRGLVAAVSHALASGDRVELLVTWIGFESKPPARRLRMRPEDLLQDSFPLDEQDFVIFDATQVSDAP